MELASDKNVELITTSLTGKEAPDILADFVVLERQLFEELLHRIADELPRIQKTASGVARLDVLTALAETAVKNNYTKPVVDSGDALVIREGRHPVIEHGRK